jgi:hypothetical protein
MHRHINLEPSVLIIHSLQIQLHSIMEKLKIPECRISLTATDEGDDIIGGLVTADVMLCEEQMAQCEGHTSAGRHGLK